MFLQKEFLLATSEEKYSVFRVFLWKKKEKNARVGAIF